MILNCQVEDLPTLCEVYVCDRFSQPSFVCISSFHTPSWDIIYSFIHLFLFTYSGGHCAAGGTREETSKDY